MTCRSFRNASSSPRPPKTTCATPTGGSASPRARRSSPSASRMGAQACASLHVGHAPVVSRRSLRCEPPRPIASTSRGSPRGDPPHKHAPPSEAHPQWPQRAREDAVSSLPPRLLAPSGSGSSGRRTPALASAGASETAPIARPNSGDPRMNASAVRRSCAPHRSRRRHSKQRNWRKTTNLDRRAFRSPTSVYMGIRVDRCDFKPRSGDRRGREVVGIYARRV